MAFLLEPPSWADDAYHAGGPRAVGLTLINPELRPKLSQITCSKERWLIQRPLQRLAIYGSLPVSGRRSPGLMS
jgi:hypothetical protein